jgi:hypothetical protein
MAEQSSIAGVPAFHRHTRLPSCSIIYLFYGPQQQNWCTVQPGPPEMTQVLTFLQVFILWLSTAAYLVYLLPWAPEMRQVLNVLKVFYSMVGHSGIPGVLSNVRSLAVL